MPLNRPSPGALSSLVLLTTALRLTLYALLLPLALVGALLLAVLLPRGTWPLFWGRVLADAVRFRLWRR